MLSTWSKDTGLNSTTDYDQMRKFFSQKARYVFHNGIRFDKPHIERLLGIKIQGDVIDSLALSWTMFPDRNRHGLESWGEDFGIKKPKITNWENLPVETYINRCQEDVKINVRVWNYIYLKLKGLYKKEEDLWRYVDYINFKMHCAALQEESGWLVDAEYCEKSLKELITERNKKTDELRKLMPKVPVKETKTLPKRLTRKDGTLTKIGQSWYDLLGEQNLPKETYEVEVVKDYQEGNPGSTQQVKDWLFSLGWVPRTFKHKKDKDGNPKEIPQINLENGKGICPSIKDLYEKEPNLEYLDGLSVLNHRIPILKGFLDTRDKDGYVKAQIQGLTNTLRFQHSHPCVNLPKYGKLYADGIRGSLIAPKGYTLCGADMSGLEDRLKQHFIYPLDPDYVESMNRKDYDPHLTLAVFAGMITQDQMDKYLSGEDKSIKPIRDQAKNGNYACQYNAYPPRLAITCGITLDKAKELFNGYWKLNWAIKEVSSNQKIITMGEEMWMLNPVSGFWYSLRSKNDVFSTLVQGTASFVFDLWVKYILEEREQLTAQFHDEVVLCIRKGFEQQASDLCTRALEKTNNELKLNRQLDIGIQFGDRYSLIH